MSARAVLAGRLLRPELHLYFHASQPHATVPDKTLREWVESYILTTCRGRGHWVSRGGYWRLTATGPDAAGKLAKAGFVLDFTELSGTDMEAVIGLEEIEPPVTKLSGDGTRALVLPRLFGFEWTKELLGSGALWDREFQRFTLPVASAMRDGAPVPGINWDPAIIRAAQESLGRIVVRDEIRDAAAAAGAAKDPKDMDASDLAQLIELVGDVPDWFGLDLFPFQRIGAVAVAAGHFGLFDEPGLGKTRQSIAAAAIVGAERTVITSLPVVLTHWAKEVEESRLHTLGGKNPDGQIVIIRSGKKEPDTLPERGVIITTDALLAARPALRNRLTAWKPDAVIYDEAHRGKNFTSSRSEAMLALSTASRLAPIAVTGTPIFANPAELAPLLEFTGHLGPVFGGLSAYLDRYTKPDPWGGRVPRKEHLPELSMKLQQQVWVRRRKHDVLPDLPRTLNSPKWVDVPLTEYRRAYKEVIEKLTWWVKAFRRDHEGEDPTDEEIHDYAAEQVGMVSMLRRSGGVAKIPAIVEDIRAHVADTGTYLDAEGRTCYTRPLIVWGHHIEVLEALSEAVPAAVEHAGVIRGGVANAVRDDLVAQFQQNRIPVLVCSIVAAGVGITLTAASDMFFAESDWTPANVRQAMDRAERIGQTADKILATTYLAPGTLDPRVQEVLRRKSKILDAVYGTGNDVSVDIDSGDVESATEILVGLIGDIIAGNVEKP